MYVNTPALNTSIASPRVGPLGPEFAMIARSCARGWMANATAKTALSNRSSAASFISSFARPYSSSLSESCVAPEGCTSAVGRRTFP